MEVSIYSPGDGATGTSAVCGDCSLLLCPNVVFSNGTARITAIDQWLDASFGEGFSAVGVQVSAYTLISESGTPSTIFGTFSPSLSTEVSLATPYLISSTWFDPDYETVLTSFGSGLHPGCDVVENYASTAAPGAVPFWTGSSSPSNLPNSAPATATVASPSPSPSPSQAARSSPRWKLIIGLVVPIVVLMIFFTIGLTFFCISRRRRRRTKAAAASNRANRGVEGQDARLYFQQKAELEDKPRKLRMKSVEHRYELEGEERVLELHGESATVAELETS